MSMVQNALIGTLRKMQRTKEKAQGNFIMQAKKMEETKNSGFSQDNHDAYQNPSVAVIILSYNVKEELRNAIKSVNFSSYPNLSIIVVDNNSIDGSSEMVSLEFPHVILIKSEVNLGFGGGNNLGIEMAQKLGVDYMFFLNDDAEVEKNTISGLVDFMECNSDAAISTPIIIQKGTEMILYAGGNYNNLLTYTKNVGWREQFSSYYGEKPYVTEFCDFCAAMVRASSLLKVGHFDTRYFLYANGLDLSLRIRQNGGKIYVIPKTIVHHTAQASANPAEGTKMKLSASSIYYYSTEYVIFIRSRNGPIISTIKILLRSIFIMPYYLIFYADTKDKLASLIQFVKGTIHGLGSYSR